MWFCREEGIKRGDRGIIERAAKVADWAYRQGRDEEFGGIIAYLDFGRAEPMPSGWHKENNVLWDDKVWWVHTESLYALLLCAVTLV